MTILADAVRHKKKSMPFPAEVRPRSRCPYTARQHMRTGSVGLLDFPRRPRAKKLQPARRGGKPFNNITQGES